MNSYPYLRNTPATDVRATLILAHGAGAAMDSDFMNTISEQLSLRGCEVIRFEFPYMSERRVHGSKRPPNPAAQLLDSWREHLAGIRASLPRNRKLLLGGKSLGGRMASMIVDESDVDGLICLGYPFHPVGKPQKLRTAHLEALQTRALVVQGTRDSLGSKEEVETYALSPAIQLLWLEDGDHDFKPRKQSGFTQQQHITTAAHHVAEFIHRI